MERSWYVEAAALVVVEDCVRVRLPWRRAKEFERQGVKCIERESGKRVKVTM